MSVTIAAHKSRPPLPSPVAGMAWLIARKYRTALLFLAVAWPLIVAWGRMAYGHAGILDGRGFLPVIALPGTILFFPLVLFADIAPNLLTRPVSTRALAGWHMLWGGASVALIWILNAECLWIPLGFPVTPWWPAAALAGIACCAQAVRWLPVGLGPLHAVLFLLVPGAVGMVFLAASGHGVAPSSLAAGGIALWAVMYPAGIAALARRRRGDVFDLSRALHGLTSRSPVRPLRPFRGALMAQAWYEFRGHGLLLPGSVAGLAFITMCLLCFDATEPITLIQLLSGGKIVVEANVWANALPDVSLMAGLYLAVVIGGVDSWLRRPDRTLNTFFATRPMGSGNLAGVKIVTAALSAVATVVFLLPFWAFWLLLPAHGNGTSGTLGGYLIACAARYLDGGDVALLLGSGAALFILTWKLQIDSLFAHLTGRSWIGWVILAVCFGPVLIVSLALDIRQSASLYRTLAHDLPLWLPVTAAAKLAATAFVLCLLRRFRLISVPALIRIAAVWVIVAAALTALFTEALAPMRVSVWTIASAMALIMPGARAARPPLGPAPLAKSTGARLSPDFFRKPRGFAKSGRKRGPKTIMLFLGKSSSRSRTSSATSSQGLGSRRLEGA